MAKLIGLIGAPSSGKTTLANALFNAFNAYNIPATLVREFVSDDIEKRGAPSFEYYIYEQYRFLFHQMRREEQAKEKAEGYIITDCPTLIGYAYTLQQIDSIHLGRQPSFKEELTALFKEDFDRYDHLYFLEREALFEDNGIRFHSEETSKEFSILLKELLTKHKVKHKHVYGDVPTRENQILEDLGIYIS